MALEEFIIGGFTYSKSKLSNTCKDYVYARENNSQIEFISKKKYDQAKKKGGKITLKGGKKKRRSKKGSKKGYKSGTTRRSKRIRKRKSKSKSKPRKSTLDPFAEADALITKPKKRKSKRRKRKVSRPRAPTHGEFMCEDPYTLKVDSKGKGTCVMDKKSLRKKYTSKSKSTYTPNLQDYIPPRIVSKTQRNILSNLVGKRAVKQMEQISTMEHVGLLPDKNNPCPPFGQPTLSQAWVNPKTKRVVCREPYLENVAIKGIPKGTCGKGKEHYVDHKGVGRCRKPVTDGYWQCPPMTPEDSDRTVHKTLPNGTGICVKDVNTNTPFITPFSIVTRDSALAKKLNLFYKTFIGLKMKGGDVEMFKIIMDRINNLNDITNIKMSIHNVLLLNKTKYGTLVKLMKNPNIGKKAFTNLSKVPKVNEILQGFKNSNTMKIMKQLLVNRKTRSTLGYINLVLNHIHVEADLPLFKVAINAFSHNILRIPPPLPVRDSDLAFFGLDKKARRREMLHMKKYFDKLGNLLKMKTKKRRKK